MLLIVGMSGCTLNDDTQENNQGSFDLSSYAVETYSEDMERIGEGFVHDENAYWYVINGTVENNMGYMTTIRINLSFFDSNDTFLDSTFTHVTNVSSGQNETFQLRVHLDFFEETEKVTFELSEKK